MVTELDRLLDQVRAADRMTRIELRDPVASFGSEALAPMAEWIDDQEFSRFAIRVIERIGQQDGLQHVAAGTLINAYPEAPTPDIADDIEQALGRLGTKLRRPRGVRAGARDVSAGGQPGVPGRRYWAFRTTPRYPEFIWTEAIGGRLRQGWGYIPEQDLRLVALRKQAGEPISPEEQAAWRARRMMATEADGMRFGDLVVSQNLPRHGSFSVWRVVGSYDYDIPVSPEDFGHLIPVESVRQDVSMRDADVSEALRRALSIPGRMHDITAYGGDLERLLAGVTALASITERPVEPVALPVSPTQQRASAESSALRTDRTAPLSGAFERLYDQMLETVSARPIAMPNLVCLHWPMHEPSYSGRLLVVGQALNGWGHMAVPTDLAHEPVRTQELAATRRSSEKDGAFDWMRPDVWRRPFWLLARSAMDALGLALREIAWSNLAKLSPADGGNPNGELLAVQHDLGGRLLRQEILELQPDIVLIVSGRGYTSPFLRGAGIHLDWSPNGALQFAGEVGGRQWIVVNHPGTFVSRLEASRTAVLTALR